VLSHWTKATPKCWPKYYTFLCVPVLKVHRLRQLLPLYSKWGFCPHGAALRTPVLHFNRCATPAKLPTCQCPAPSKHGTASFLHLQYLHMWESTPVWNTHTDANSFLPYCRNSKIVHCSPGMSPKHDDTRCLSSRSAHNKHLPERICRYTTHGQRKMLEIPA